MACWKWLLLVSAVLWQLSCGVTNGQVSAAATPLQFRFLEGGPFGWSKTVPVSLNGAWSVRIEPESAYWMSVSPDKGQGSAQITLNPVGWAAKKLPPGKHSLTVLFRGPNGAVLQSIPVQAEVVARRPDARFTYLKGPTGCKRPPEYIDEATCEVPDERPPGSFRPPLRNESYVDPNFGATVRVITDPPAVHAYSYPSAISAQNKYVLVSRRDNWTAVSPVDGKIIRENLPANERLGTMWDAIDPETLYILQKQSVQRYNVRTGKTQTVANYAKGPIRFSSITNGGASDTSRDNWISFFAPDEREVCALDLNTGATYCSSFDRLGRVFLNPNGKGTLIAKGIDRPTGKRYVVLVAAPTMAVFSVNLEKKKLDFEYLFPERLGANEGRGNGDGVCDPDEACYVGEHTDTFEDENGVQFIIGEFDRPEPCAQFVYSYRINKGKDVLTPEELGGGARHLMTLQVCGGRDVWTDFHLGCAKFANSCVISTTYGKTGFQRHVRDHTPMRRSAHLSEIFVIRDNGAEIRRLMQHRSVPLSDEEAQSYWSTPRACMSNDGTLVVGDSNFGESNRQRVFVVETGYPPSAPATKASPGTGR